MNRVIFAASCILLLCVGSVLAAGTVAAYQAGYEITDYTLTTTPTIDGTWTSSDEWSDSVYGGLEGGLNATFRLNYLYATTIDQYFLIEVFDDVTEDAGDYFVICYNSAPTLMGSATGGTAPHENCLKFEYVGHTDSESGLTVYQGDGSAWVAGPAYTWPTDIEIASSVSASPSDATPHVIYEIKIEHGHFAIQPEFWIYVAVHDESNAGETQSWPPGSSDVPDDWGLMSSSQETVPEALTIGVVVLLSSVAVAASFYCLRKRPKTEN